jgi:hypothetical protein
MEIARDEKVHSGFCPLVALHASGVAAGNGALALAALIDAYSPVLAESDKRVPAALLERQLDLPFTACRKISVQADHVTCSAGNVDISRHSCDLTFGKQTAALAARKAHELYATLIEIGVPLNGAAGISAARPITTNSALKPGPDGRQAAASNTHLRTIGPQKSNIFTTIWEQRPWSPVVIHPMRRT